MPTTPPATGKTTKRTPARRADVLNRLRSVRGHVDAVIRMVEEDAYCIDVIKQVAALRAALDRVGRIELRRHFETCFTKALRSRSGRASATAIDEIFDALAFKKEMF